MSEEVPSDNNGNGGNDGGDGGNDGGDNTPVVSQFTTDALDWHNKLRTTPTASDVTTTLQTMVSEFGHDSFGANCWVKPLPGGGTSNIMT